MSKVALLSALVSLASTIGGSSAAADEPSCPMTYSAFEYAVPHLDLEECPAALARDGAFCRASVASDALHVFVFALEGEQCLLAVQSYNEDEFTLAVR